MNVADECRSVGEQLVALELENSRLHDELVCLHETNTDKLQQQIEPTAGCADNNAG